MVINHLPTGMHVQVVISWDINGDRMGNNANEL